MSNYYQILGLNVNCSLDQIERAWRLKAFQLHNDKIKQRKLNCSAEDKNDMLFEYSRCNQAYEIIKDPCKRILYDISIGIRENSIEEINKVKQMKRSQAYLQLSYMQKTYLLNKQTEMDSNGLVIIRARYGLFNKLNSSNLLDVTVPLQHLVHDHVCFIQETDSYCQLEGFYDPVYEDTENEKQLEIFYLFLNKMHHVIFCDGKQIQLPLSGHQMLSNDLQSENERCKKRRDHCLNLISESFPIKHQQNQAKFFILLNTIIGLIGHSAFSFFFSKSNSSSPSPTLPKYSPITMESLWCNHFKKYKLK